MIVGDSVKKRVVITHTQLNENLRSVLFDGVVDIENQDTIAFTYLEPDQKTKVLIKASKDSFMIQRKGDMISNIPLKLNEKTNGSIVTEYGAIDFVFYMHKYHFLENVIACEYDVYVDDELNESMRIVCKIKEVEA